MCGWRSPRALHVGYSWCWTLPGTTAVLELSGPRSGSMMGCQCCWQWGSKAGIQVQTHQSHRDVWVRLGEAGLRVVSGSWTPLAAQPWIGVEGGAPAGEPLEEQQWGGVGPLCWTALAGTHPFMCFPLSLPFNVDLQVFVHLLILFIISHSPQRLAISSWSDCLPLH